jgi:HAD superfamily hydrolase (TIGR01509 family)
MKTILVDAAYTFTVDGKVFKEMYELLETYPNRKIILTNANDEQMPKYGLVDLPYELFTLSHQPDKDDPVYFQKMLEHFDLKVEDVVYFEHGEGAVKSAESIGIKSYHYDADKKDLVALKNFLDQNL